MDPSIMEFSPAWRSSEYYFFPDDVRKYPDAWMYVVWSRRGPGKTYSFLRSMLEPGTRFAYMKRTMKDVALICANKYGVDISPFSPVNRDAGTSVRPQLIGDGIGGFYAEQTEDGKPEGLPVGYVLALNAIKEIKGMELSDVDFMCLDEFIPQPGERISRSEGELLLSIYMTMQRDRIKRGRQPLKLVMFSNADQIATPITAELDIMDRMADLTASGKTHLYDEDRGILLHHITDYEVPLKKEELTGVYKAMKDTSWGRKAFGGEFAGNDFSNVGRKVLKGFRCAAAFTYRNRTAYIYRKSGEIYITYTRGQTPNIFDLTHENDQKRFYYDYILDIRESLIENRVTCEAYSLYDLIVNYKKIFAIT